MNQPEIAFTNARLDAQRAEFLFERYQQLTSLLPATATPKRRKGLTDGRA
jgi:hypothetical protein